MKKDYYKILGLEHDANKIEIRKAYLKLCHRFHPDKGGDERAFFAIQEAYEHLYKNDITNDIYYQSYSAESDKTEFNSDKDWKEDKTLNKESETETDNFEMIDQKIKKFLIGLAKAIFWTIIVGCVINLPNSPDLSLVGNLVFFVVSAYCIFYPTFKYFKEE